MILIRVLCLLEDLLLSTSKKNFSIFMLYAKTMGLRDIKAHLLKFKVGIAGAGGLGSNCAVALARSGIGTLVICDFDIVELPNLNRQYYFSGQAGKLKVQALKENISGIDREINVITFPEKLNERNIPEIFKGCHAIVEALDSAEMKEMLIETVQTKLPGVPVIAGSGLAGWGRNNDLRCRKIDETLFICGDELSEDSPETPVMAPRVGIVACMQANIVVELLMNKK